LGKQLHWSVVGPHFRSLHLQLDELVGSWRELADTVAERAIAIGAAVDGQASAVAAASPLEGVEPGAIDDATLVRELATRLAETAERTRERAERVAELDTASEDLLIEVIRTLEEQLWMVRAQLPTTAPSACRGRRRATRPASSAGPAAWSPTAARCSSSGRCCSCSAAGPRATSAAC